MVNKVNLSSFSNHGCVVAFNCVTRMQTHFSANPRAPTKQCFGKLNLIAVIKRPAAFLIWTPNYALIECIVVILEYDPPIFSYSLFIHFFLRSLYLHITFLWVLPQKQWFYRHPLHWQNTTVRLHIYFTLVNISSEAKVSDLHDVVFSNKNVSGRQVSVNTLDKTNMFWKKKCKIKKSETRRK